MATKVQLAEETKRFFEKVELQSCIFNIIVINLISQILKNLTSSKQVKNNTC